MNLLSSSHRRKCTALSLAAWLVAPLAPAASAQAPAPRARTPIRHVIVIIGENRTFDHLFATYQPPAGQSVRNLLSEGIVTATGAPGPHFNLAVQNSAQDTTTFSLSPGGQSPYPTLPPPNTDGAPTNAPFTSTAAASAAEPGLFPWNADLLSTGGTGLPGGTVDIRIANAFGLPSGPFPLTPSLSYDDYAGSPVHRFYQMWQQADCSAAAATFFNPSGCRSDLFPWIETSIGAGNNGAAQPSAFNLESTGEGSISMGFYNMAQGDAPYFNFLARTYALSDNYHQAVMGGTGANHVAMGTGDAIWFSDGHGHSATPPSNQIENPNPQPGTNNWYVQDGYSGGTYSQCSDPAQPGVGPIRQYLAALAAHPNPNCAPGHYYLLNNYAPGYFGDGSVNTGAVNPFTIPPSSLRNIGDELLEKNISWRYYGDGFDRYLQDPNFQNPLDAYCDICNFFQYSTSIMTNAAVRTTHLKDTVDLDADIANGWLPAVAFVKPSGFVDGHPASSKFDLFEAFTRRIIEEVQAQPQLWRDTAIFITVDEGGGYYDSGYIQPLDYFGDGTRIPLIAVSPYARGGSVVHSYTDHVSILKFIEANWGLDPLTGRSRDNLPNPVALPWNPYVPVNGPAIGNLMDMFDFDHPHFDRGHFTGHGH